MPKFNMLSAHAIASDISAGRLTPNAALSLGDEACTKLEEKLQVYSHNETRHQLGKGPLRGVGIGVKDIFDTHDMPTRYGSKIYHDHQPIADAALVNMLKQAGATIVGKTVTTEFAWFTPGPTRNPHNQRHTPGGSSSGSAAGVAAGYFPAAIGSQTGGSIIRPASFCGVSGYKPSFRLFPTIGMKHFSWSLDTVGFFAASTLDAAFIAANCSGRDLTVDQFNSSAPRVGFYQSSIDHLMLPEMKTALENTRHLLRDRGAEIVTIAANEKVEAARGAHAPIQGYEAVLSLSDEMSRNSKGISKKLRDYLKDARAITPEIYDDARRTANHARKQCASLFEKCDVLILPSSTGTAPRGLSFTGDSIFNQLWTLMGLPCVNVAGLVGDNGLPLGIQVIAPFGRDKIALQAAHWIETQIKDMRASRAP